MRVSVRVSQSLRGLMVAASITLAFIAPGRSASAQDVTRPLLVSGEYSALGLDRASDPGTGVNGFGIRADYRLTRRIDVDSRLLWFPKDSLQEFEAQGGRTTQVGVGVRGKLLVGKHTSFYGVLLPELLHFSDTIVDISGVNWTTGASTHFAIDWGVGTEIKTGNRWGMHVELTGPLMPSPSRN